MDADASTAAGVSGAGDSNRGSGAEAARSALIEGIIAESEDETLMDRYLGGEQIPLDTLIEDLETAVARGSFFPVLATSPEWNYEDGLLAGYLAAQMAVRARLRDLA